MGRNLFHIVVLSGVLALAGCLGPDSPEEQLQAITELQTKKLPLTEEQKTGLDEHLAKGREALAAGNKEAASAAFAKALEILKVAEDTALFNKAD